MVPAILGEDGKPEPAHQGVRPAAHRAGEDGTPLVLQDPQPGVRGLDLGDQHHRSGVVVAAEVLHDRTGQPLVRIRIEEDQRYAGIPVLPLPRQPVRGGPVLRVADVGRDDVPPECPGSRDGLAGRALDAGHGHDHRAGCALRRRKVARPDVLIQIRG